MHKELRDAILRQHARRDFLMKILFCNSKPRRRKRWRLFAILLTTSFVLQIAKPTAALKSTQFSSTNHSREEEGDDKSFAILLTTPLSCRLQDRPAAWGWWDKLQNELRETDWRNNCTSSDRQSNLTKLKSAQFFSTQKPPLLILLLPDSTVKTLQRRVEISLAWTLFGIAKRTRKPLCTSRYDEHTEETTLGLAFALTIISVSVSILREENASLPAWFAWSETRWGLVSETREEKEKETKVVMMMMVVATECKLLQTNFWKHMQKKTVLMMMMP